MPCKLNSQPVQGPSIQNLHSQLVSNNCKCSQSVQATSNKQNYRLPQSSNKTAVSLYRVPLTKLQSQHVYGGPNKLDITKRWLFQYVYIGHLRLECFLVPSHVESRETSFQLHPNCFCLLHCKPTENLLHIVHSHLSYQNTLLDLQCQGCPANRSVNIN